ncbi:MAG TPA: hypothetical protein VFN70_18240 [Burkholderiales bacterium]|nr:hypothetical protein [Burkholderiales bacterium]
MRACIPITPLGTGALFFLVEPEAEVGCTIANRVMTADEHAQYRANPACLRRRRPGLTVEQDEERLRKLRAQALYREIQVDERNGVVPFAEGWHLP